MCFNFVLIDGLKMQGWLKELRKFEKNNCKLLNFGMPKSKQPGHGKPGANKSYDTC